MFFLRARRCKALIIGGLLCLPFLLTEVSALAADAKSVARVSLGSDGAQGSSTGLPDPFTGAMSYSIPIDVPAGRKGMDPGLSLNYRSHNGDGWIGVGWELELGAIQRNFKNGTNFSGNSYQLRKSGETQDLVDVGEGTYLATIESDFSQIQQATAADRKIYWRVIDKVGTTFSYGMTPESRQNDPNNSQNIYKWCLDRIEDLNGNYITISYVKEKGQIYSSKIMYTGNSVDNNLPTNLV